MVTLLVLLQLNRLENQERNLLRTFHVGGTTGNVSEENKILEI